MKRKLIALMLLAGMTLSVFTACNDNAGGGDTTTTTAGTTTTAANGDTTEPADTTAPEGGTGGTDTPLVVAYQNFSEKFSPFFAETGYDMDVAHDMLSVGLVSIDRSGSIVEKSIGGETRSYNGTDYTYTGITDIEITIDEATDTTTYNFKLREGVKFSDGRELTADDVLFSYYVYCDPSYTGASTVYSLAIQGMNSYRTQTSEAGLEKYGAVVDAILAGDAAGYTQAQYDEFWALADEFWLADIQAIVDYCDLNYFDVYGETYTGMSGADLRANEGLRIAAAMALWGGGSIDLGDEEEGLEATGVLTGRYTEKTWDLVTEFPTLEDMMIEFQEHFDYDFVAYIDGEESPYGTEPLTNLSNQAIKTWSEADTEIESGAITSISGIRKINDYEIEIVIDGFDAAAIYRLGITVGPMHYYGDESLWDPDNGSYGFTYGNLDIVHEKDRTPMGAGPYKFVKYENKVVYFEANEHYWDGVPKTKYVQFKEGNEVDFIPGIANGTSDIATPSVTLDRYAEIAAMNSNGEVTGDVVSYEAVLNLGYGYIGISADNVRVGEESDSEASKNWRKGFATILSVYRDLTVSSYYGDTASVINYPISDTSWAAPQRVDAGYREAFSVDANGNDIFTSAMDAEARYTAAMTAALSFFEAAGATVVDGKVTAAPAGARMEYEIIIPADGNQDHPTFALLTAAKADLATLGLTLTINDPADSNVLWNALDAGTADMWCAAWGSTTDPDMYQVYHSNNVTGNPGGSGSNRYMIRDALLDQYIMDARKSADQSYRKQVYKDCLDIIMDWAVEIPVYQRQLCTIFSTQRVNMDTMTKDLTPYWEWMAEVHLIEMN